MPNEDGAAVVNNEQVAEDTTAAVATTDETTKSEGGDDQAYETVMGDNGEVQRVKRSESDDNDGDDEQPTGQKRGADARREQLNAEMQSAQDEIRQMVSARNEMLQEQQQLQSEIARMRESHKQSQMPTVEQLMEMENPETKDYYSEFEAQSIVENLQLKQQLDQLNQQRESDIRNAQIAESVNGLSGDAQKALSQFPEFDSESPDYDPELTAQADEIVLNSLIRDERGNVIGSNIPVYDVYKALSGARSGSRKAAQVNTDFRGSGQASTKKFSDLSASEMEAVLRRKGQIK